MEIKLSDEDFERLAALLERRISDRVIGLLASGPAFDALSERARMFATAYIGKDEFEHQAIDGMRKAIEADGQKLLRQVVNEAVAHVHKADPGLRKAVAQGVYEAAVAHAERLRPSDEDC